MVRLQDKDAKVAYLTKIISCVGLALDQNVPARPHKVRPLYFKLDVKAGGNLCNTIADEACLTDFCQQ